LEELEEELEEEEEGWSTGIICSLWQERTIMSRIWEGRNEARLSKIPSFVW